jgi:hypothetical protein
VKGHFKWQVLKEPKLAHLDKVLCRWFTAVHSKAEPVTGSMIIGTHEAFYGEMKITDKLQNIMCKN